MPLVAELSPEELVSLVEEGVPTAIALGAIEWHGPHLPLGLDGLVAEHFVSTLSEHGLILQFPTLWLPMTTLPHRTSRQVSTETFRAVVDETIEGLIELGSLSIALVTGHYAQGQLYELYEAAERAMAKHSSARVFAATPFEPLGDDDLLDHAGEVETAQLLAIRPDLVWSARLPEAFHCSTHAVLGQSPHLASAEQGRKLLNDAALAWTSWLTNASRDDLSVHYHNRKATLEGYRSAFYRGSWEGAIRSWWATKA